MSGQPIFSRMLSNLDVFERALARAPLAAGGDRVCGGTCPRGRRARSGGGFTLTELLVALAIMLVMVSMAAGAIAASRSRHKRIATEALIGKIDAIVSAYYSGFASRSVDSVAGADRGAVLRQQVAADLPESWVAVAELAMGDEPLTGPQQAYVAVLLANQRRSAFDLIKLNEFGNAECLFMIIMQGGVSGCLDCRSLRLDVGDVDGDGNPEFLDAWGTPISFILWPSELRLPADASKRFFSAALPFDPVMPVASDSQGGLMRPLIYSAGPDREYGLMPDAGPLAGARDNITNFDAEAKQ